MSNTQEAAQGGPGNATDDRGGRWYHTAATTVSGSQEPSSSSIHEFQRSESMATSSKTYSNEDAARLAVETLRVASVPPREIRLLTSRPLADIRREPVGGFAGPVGPDAPVGTFAGSTHRRSDDAGSFATGSFAGDAHQQRQGSFGDVERVTIVTYKADAERLPSDRVSRDPAAAPQTCARRRRHRTRGRGAPQGPHGRAGRRSGDRAGRDRRAARAYGEGRLSPVEVLLPPPPSDEGGSALPESDCFQGFVIIGERPPANEPAGLIVWTTSTPRRLTAAGGALSTT